MIADRRSQIAIRSAIVCDHMETYFCDRLRSPAINCDCAIISKPKFCDPRSKRIPSFQQFNARVFDCRNGLRSNNHFVVISRNLWRKLLCMNVFTIAAAKTLKHTRTKRLAVGTKSGRSFIYRPGKQRPNFST